MDLVSDYSSAAKKSMKSLIFTLHLVNFYDPCTGLAGIILILPAGIARPAPTENALAEFRDRVRR
jgi:hypothetical protein